MKSLLTAVKTRFDSQLAALAPLYAHRIVEGEAKPYARYVVLPASNVTHAFGNKTDGWFLQDVLVQFDVWHSDHSALLGYQQDLHDAFDNVVLTLSAGAYGTETLIRADRMSNHVFQEQNDENGDETYRATTTYRFTVDHVG